jgi:hypothetical protein
MPAPLGGLDPVSDLTLQGEGGVAAPPDGGRWKLAPRHGLSTKRRGPLPQ